MSLTGFDLDRLFWVDPSSRQIFDATDPHIPNYAWSRGKWYGQYGSQTTLGLTRLYDVTLLMFLQPNATTVTGTPPNQPLWEKFISGSAIQQMALCDDVLRGSTWTTDHADMSTRNIAVADRVQLDGDIYTVDTSQSFNLQNTLFFVNGMYHRSFVDTGNAYAAYIRDGFRTLNQERDYYQVHAVDFTPIGGVTTYPITSSMVTSGSDDTGMWIFITIPTGGLTGAGLAISIAGSFFFPGNGLSVISDTILRVDPVVLDLSRRFYQSPMLRKKAPVYPAAGLETSSDITDELLDVFNSNQAVPSSDLEGLSFFVEQLTSPHSALFVLPSSVVLQRTQLEYETNEKELLYVAQNTAVTNSSLLFRGMVGSPTFLDADAARARSYIWSPWITKPAVVPADDPYRKIDLSPAYDRETQYDIRPEMSLIQWISLL